LVKVCRKSRKYIILQKATEGDMSFPVKEDGGFKYIDEGKGEVLLLLHGLFGALSNWDAVIRGFAPQFRVVIPVMPIYEMPTLPCWAIPWGDTWD
jgi:hypothetical protein